jgi:hypothetical protein
MLVEICYRIQTGRYFHHDKDNIHHDRQRNGLGNSFKAVGAP